jgi:hypothetical protein
VAGSSISFDGAAASVVASFFTIGSLEVGVVVDTPPIDDSVLFTLANSSALFGSGRGARSGAAPDVPN